MADSSTPLRRSLRLSSCGASSSTTDEHRNYHSYAKGSIPDKPPTMTDPISTPEISTRKAITATSGCHNSKRHKSSTLVESDSLPVGSTAGKNSFITKLQTSSVDQKANASSHGSRPSISSVSSASTTGSSIRSDSFFDTRSPVQLSDSNPTSPEEDSSSVASKEAKISIKIDSDYKALAEQESPLIDRERRRKLSTKQLPGQNSGKILYNSLIRHHSTLDGTQSTVSGLDNKSTAVSISPFADLDGSSGVKVDSTPLSRTRSTSLRPLQAANADQRARASSTSGRIEKISKDRAEVPDVGKEQDGPSKNSMNLSPADVVQQQTAKDSKGSNLRGKKQTIRSRSQENTAPPPLPKIQSLPDSSTRSTGHLGVRNQAALELGLTEKTVEEPGAQLSSNQQDNAQSVSESTLEEVAELTTEENRDRPIFRRFHTDSLTKAKIQEQLIEKIKFMSSPQKGRLGSGLPSWIKPGYVYVFTLPSCKQAPTTESATTYEYFKVGVTHEKKEKTRIKKQKPCYQEEIIPIEVKYREPFAFAELVEKLVHLEFQEHRMTAPCIGPHKKSTGDSSDHSEWFQVEEQCLLDSIEKWRSWITKNDPYYIKEYRLQYCWHWTHIFLNSETRNNEVNHDNRRHTECHLKPHWQWKLNRFKYGSKGKELHDVLKPFTFREELEYRTHWTFRQISDLITLVRNVVGLVSSSFGILALFGATIYLASSVSLILGEAFFALAISLIVVVVPKL